MNPYEDLSDDNFVAFLQLEREFRNELEKNLDDGNNNNWEWYAPEYMNKVLAAAKQLGIEALSAHSTPYGNKLNFDAFTTFQRDVDHVIVQMRIINSRRVGKYRVGLSSDQKTKLHAHIKKIRVVVEASNASSEKKEALFDIISRLSLEIDKDRTRYERFADLARSLAGLSKDVAEEGAEPWWKWFKLAAGVIDEAKENEPKLPPPPDVKRIEAPRKELPKPDNEGGYRSMDDEIPF